VKWLKKYGKYGSTDVGSFNYGSYDLKDVYKYFVGKIFEWVGKKLDKYVFSGVNEFIESAYVPINRNRTDELYDDNPLEVVPKKVPEIEIEIKHFDPKVKKWGKKIWAYTQIEKNKQTIYLPYKDKVKELLPKEFWYYLEGGTLKIKDKYIKVKRKVKDAAKEFLKYLLDHELTHLKYAHLGNEKLEEVYTELDTLTGKDPEEVKFREYLHAYGLVAKHWLSEQVAKVNESIGRKAKEYKTYMESLGFNLQPVEVRS